MPYDLDAAPLHRAAGPLGVEGETCVGIRRVLARVGDKWTVLVVMLLRERPHRFNELKRAVGGVSQRMLTLTLRGLERDGMVERTVGAGVPPRVDYALTPLGRSLAGPVLTLGDWARAHLPDIAAAQAEFDGREAAGVQSSSMTADSSRP